jgi:ABC-type glycerol-3-phosphate transport system substrate-binding protein
VTATVWQQEMQAAFLGQQSPQDSLNGIATALAQK